MPVSLAAWEAEIGSFNRDKKFKRPHLNQQKLGMVALTCYPNYTGSVNRGIEGQASLGINAETLSKK
jgi:hypothetical protein